MNYLLDTNICIYLLNGDAKLKSKIARVGVFSVGVTNAVIAELYFGAFNSGRVDENCARVESFWKSLVLVPETPESSRLFGKIKFELKSRGTMIDDFDILIASVALANSCTLVTNNTSHFSRIKGLKVANWTKSGRTSK
jgi:tRNA(fMet)-specific endonuclease VapC